MYSLPKKTSICCFAAVFWEILTLAEAITANCQNIRIVLSLGRAGVHLRQLYCFGQDALRLI